MKRMFVMALLVVELLCLLWGCKSRMPLNQCGGSPAPEEMSSQNVSQSGSDGGEEKPSAAVCMGAVSHPIHRIVQLGFMEAADDLGYDGHILGFDESSMQELFDCWLQGAEEHDIGGALCWVGDDSTYEFLKELHGMDVKIVVPHFPHSYEETKDFIDVNICHDLNETTVKAADYIGQTLRANGITSGSIGVSANGPAIIHEDISVFREYMGAHYPEYTVLGTVFEGAETVEAQNKVDAYIRDNPDMVAGYSKTGGGTVAWAAAKELNGREDILAVGYDYTKKNLDVVSEGGAVALIAQPLYDEGYTGLELIDEMLHGKAFNASESLWYQKLDAPLVYPGGEGVHGAAMYYDMYARSEARFGINKQWEGI